MECSNFTRLAKRNICGQHAAVLSVPERCAGNRAVCAEAPRRMPQPATTPPHAAGKSSSPRLATTHQLDF